MLKNTRTITVSLSSEILSQMEEVMRAEGLTRSELLREALRRYLQEREWLGIVREATKRNQELGITAEDVDRLVREYRAEQREPG